MMTPEHPRWDEFCDRLQGPEGCDFTEAANGLKATWTCNHDRTFAIEILFAMGFSEEAVVASLDYFDDHGGHCDCEILFNVDVAAEG